MSSKQELLAYLLFQQNLLFSQFRYRCAGTVLNICNFLPKETKVEFKNIRKQLEVADNRYLSVLLNLFDTWGEVLPPKINLSAKTVQLLQALKANKQVNEVIVEDHETRTVTTVFLLSELAVDQSLLIEFVQYHQFC